MATERSPGAEQPQPPRLPIVPSEVTNRILEDVTSINAMDELTLLVFGDLVDSNKNLAEVINKCLVERFNQPTAEPMLNGMAIIIQVFNHTQDFSLFQKISGLQPDDLDLAKQTLEKSFPPKEQDMTTLQKLLELPRIPEQQISLNECLKKTEVHSHGLRSHVREGANAMYKTLEVLWPKLYPPQTPPPPQPTTQ